MLYMPAVKTIKKAKVDYRENPELFEILRKLRKELADKQGVPPYVIFSDVTLKEMTNSLPQNKDDFADVKGVGKLKLEKYADIFLAEITRYSPVKTSL